jgi:endonuclease VIII
LAVKTDILNYSAECNTLQSLLFMPEGPEIKRAADKIAAALVQHPVKEVWFAFDHLKHYEEALTAQKIIAVEPRGKALLTRFENGLSIYSHNQLYGKWEIRRAYSYPQTSRQLRLAIHNSKKSALLYSASDIEVLDEAAISTHPFLTRLGPDVLSDTTTIEMIQSRLGDPAFRRRRFTTLLLDQHFLAGLGNYLRSEIPFVARVHPSLRPVDCSEAQLFALAEAAIAIPLRSYQTGGITNDLELAATLKARGLRRSQYRHWVFSRASQPCFVCGTPIVKDVAGARRFYYCPNCQPL